ncbi:MAG TPA: lipid II flippase MurJ, partial [Chitinophagales bacterium]|nr:lipid II flippase MurJ [Chitinophagales bacterium]
NQKMFPSSIINLGYSIIWFGIVFFLPSVGIEVNIIFLLYILINFVKFILYWASLKHHKLLVGHIKNFRTSSKQIVKESWPYFVLILIMLPLTSLSNNFLDINSTKEQIGYFNLSERLIGPLSLLITMMLTAIFPNLSALWVNDKAKFHNYLSKGFKIFMLVSMIFCFLFTMFAKEVVDLLFPKSYLPAVAVCQIQVWFLFLTSIDSLLGVVLGAANKEKLILRFGILYFMVCTPALYYGSNYGALGLSLSYVISFGSCLLYVWIIFKKSLNIKIRNDGYIWLLAFGLFGISNLFSASLDLTYKLMLSMILIGSILGYFFIRNKPLLEL